MPSNPIPCAAEAEHKAAQQADQAVAEELTVLLEEGLPSAAHKVLSEDWSLRQKPWLN